MNLAQPPAVFYRSTGCDDCGHGGFSERRFLVDIVGFDDEFQQVFEQSREVAELERYLGSVAYNGIAQEGLQLLMDGLVSPEEYIASVVL